MKNGTCEFEQQLEEEVEEGHRTLDICGVNDVNKSTLAYHV
jgi:hypothetical protein